MGFGWGEKKAAAPPPEVIEGTSKEQDTERAGSTDDHVECPPHTTESKLVSKIDRHVLPWLCIMYLLAFLGKPLFALKP